MSAQVAQQTKRTVKPVTRSKSVRGPWLEQIAETGAAHHLAKEGLIVAKPMVDIKGMDLWAYDEQVGVLAYVQVKGRQSRLKKVGQTYQPIPEMNFVELPAWVGEDPLWFVVIYWLKKPDGVYLVFSGNEFLDCKFVYHRKKDDTYRLVLNERKLQELTEQGGVVGNFRKIADAVMKFPRNKVAALQSARFQRTERIFREMEHSYRHLARAEGPLKSIEETLLNDGDSSLRSE